MCQQLCSGNRWQSPLQSEEAVPIWMITRTWDGSDMVGLSLARCEGRMKERLKRMKWTKCEEKDVKEEECDR